MKEETIKKEKRELAITVLGKIIGYAEGCDECSDCSIQFYDAEINNDVFEEEFTTGDILFVDLINGSFRRYFGNDNSFEELTPKISF